MPITGLYEESINWGPCPDDLGGPGIDCTQVEVPVNWTEEEGVLTTVLLRRRPTSRAARGRLWALDGGPGFAGDSFFDPAFADLVAAADLELYVPSHRGSIGPSSLHCSSAQDLRSPAGGQVLPEEWPGCLDELEETWGTGLAHFSVRAAAFDVAHQMDLAGDEGVSLVFGGSYGTLWAHRLLLDTDAEPDGALLDSIVPVGASLERVDSAADRAATQLLMACGEMETCAALFPGSPPETVRAAIGLYGQGEGCGQGSGVTVTSVQTFARTHLDGAPDSWIKLTAFYERLVRCTSEDEETILSLLAPRRDDAADAPSDSRAAPVHYNPVLNRHLLYRELYRFDETEEERRTFEGSALALGPNGETIRQEASVFGPGYREVDEPLRTSSSVPTTLLSGNLDPLDRPEWAVDFASTLTQGNLVRFPWAGHSTLRYLGWEQDGCGREIFVSFLKGDALSRPCIDAHPAPDLGRTQQFTQEMVSGWESASSR